MKPQNAVRVSSGHIGPRLAQLRRQRGLYLRDVERLTGIDNGHLSRIEGGRIDIKASTLLVLLAVYDAHITAVWPLDAPD